MIERSNLLTFLDDHLSFEGEIDCASGLDLARNSESVYARLLHDKHQAETFASQMQGLAVKEGHLGENQVSTTLAFSIASRARDFDQIKKRREQATLDYLLVDQIMRSLEEFETGLEDRYGKNFAMDMLADLTETGKISQDEYDRIAAIEDPQEKRVAIAALIQSKLDDGALTPGDLKDYPWALEWLDYHAEAQMARDNEKEQVLKGQKAAKNASVDGGDEATITEDSKHARVAGELVKSEDHQRSGERRDTGSTDLDDFSIGSPSG